MMTPLPEIAFIKGSLRRGVQIMFTNANRAFSFNSEKDGLIEMVSGAIVPTGVGDEPLRISYSVSVCVFGVTTGGGTGVFGFAFSVREAGGFPDNEFFSAGLVEM